MLLPGVGWSLFFIKPSKSRRIIKKKNHANQIKWLALPGAEDVVAIGLSTISNFIISQGAISQTATGVCNEQTRSQTNWNARYGILLSAQNIYPQRTQPTILMKPIFCGGFFFYHSNQLKVPFAITYYLQQAPDLLSVQIGLAPR